MTNTASIKLSEILQQFPEMFNAINDLRSNSQFINEIPLSEQLDDINERQDSINTSLVFITCLILFLITVAVFYNSICIDNEKKILEKVKNTKVDIKLTNNNISSMHKDINKRIKKMEDNYSAESKNKLNRDKDILKGIKNLSDEIKNVSKEIENTNKEIKNINTEAKVIKYDQNLRLEKFELKLNSELDEINKTMKKFVVIAAIGTACSMASLVKKPETTKETDADDFKKTIDDTSVIIGSTVAAINDSDLNEIISNVGDIKDIGIDTNSMIEKINETEPKITDNDDNKNDDINDDSSEFSNSSFINVKESENNLGSDSD
jgi:hypothetical protein